MKNVESLDVCSCLSTKLIRGARKRDALRFASLEEEPRPKIRIKLSRRKATESKYTFFDCAMKTKAGRERANIEIMPQGLKFHGIIIHIEPIVLRYTKKFQLQTST